MTADPAARYLQHLRGSFGRPLRYLPTTTSSNDVALQWADEGAPHGAVVVAGDQSAGRGRWGRSWFGAPGDSLLFSLIVRPRMDLAHLGLVGLAAGLGCRKAVAAIVDRDVRLKWPNDVLIGRRKAAGILTESRVQGDRAAVVVGIGINLRWSVEPPAELAGRATTISEHGTADAAAVLAGVLAAVEDEMSDLSDESGRRRVRTAAWEHSSLADAPVVVTFPDGHKLEGRATGIAEDGALVVACDEGEVVVRAGEVERVRTHG